MTVDLGDVVPLSINIRDAAGALANGGTVTVTITKPDLTVTGPVPVTPTTTGLYEYNYLTEQPGLHRVRWQSTGVNPASYVETFNVLEQFAGLVSLDQVKAALNETSSVHDEELRTFITAVSDVVEWLCGPMRLTTRTYSGTTQSGTVILDGPVVSVGSVTVDGQAWTDHILVADAGILTGLPRGGEVVIAYTSGRTVVPAAVQRAVIDVVRTHWRTTQQGYRPGYGEPDAEPGGSEVLGFLFSRKAMGWLEPYRRATMSGFA